MNQRLGASSSGDEYVRPFNRAAYDNASWWTPHAPPFDDVVFDLSDSDAHICERLELLDRDVVLITRPVVGGLVGVVEPPPLVRLYDLGADPPGWRELCDSHEIYARLKPPVAALGLLVREPDQRGAVELSVVHARDDFLVAVKPRQMAAMSDGSIITCFGVRTVGHRGLRGTRRLTNVHGRDVGIASVLCFFYHGPPPNATPPYSADHINGNRDDNSIFNLRWATRAQQAANRNPVRAPNVERKHFSAYAFELADLTPYTMARGVELYVALKPTPAQIAKLGYRQPVFRARTGKILGRLDEDDSGESRTIITLQYGGRFRCFAGHKIVAACAAGMSMRAFNKHALDHGVIVTHERGTTVACDSADLVVGTHAKNRADIPAAQRAASTARGAEAVAKRVQVFDDEADAWGPAISSIGAARRHQGNNITIGNARRRSVKAGGETTFTYRGSTPTRLRAVGDYELVPPHARTPVWNMHDDMIAKIHAHSDAHSASVASRRAQLDADYAEHRSSSDDDEDVVDEDSDDDEREFD